MEFLVKLGLGCVQPLDEREDGVCKGSDDSVLGPGHKVRRPGLFDRVPLPVCVDGAREVEPARLPLADPFVVDFGPGVVRDLDHSVDGAKHTRKDVGDRLAAGDRQRQARGSSMPMNRIEDERLFLRVSVNMHRPLKHGSSRRHQLRHRRRDGLENIVEIFGYGFLSTCFRFRHTTKGKGVASAADSSLQEQRGHLMLPPLERVHVLEDGLGRDTGIGAVLADGIVKHLPLFAAVAWDGGRCGGYQLDPHRAHNCLLHHPFPRLVGQELRPRAKCWLPGVAKLDVRGVRWALAIRCGKAVVHAHACLFLRATAAMHTSDDDGALRRGSLLSIRGRHRIFQRTHVLDHPGHCQAAFA